MSESQGTPPLDRDYLEAITDGDDEFLGELISSYVNSSVNTMAELREAVQGRDGHRVQHAAHALKGSSRAIGANTAGLVFETLEHRGRDGELADADTLMESAEREYNVLLDYMKRVWPVSAGASSAGVP